MSKITINVRNQTLRMAPGNVAIVSGSQDFVRFHFELDADWKELTSFAQFTQNNNSYNLYLDDNYDVYMPPEIVEGTCTLMLYGTGQVADRPAIIGTTNYLTFTIDKNHLVGDASSTEITEPLYSQLLKKMEELLDTQKNDIADLRSAINNSASEETGLDLLALEQRKTEALEIVLDEMDTLIQNLPSDEMALEILDKLVDTNGWLDMIYNEMVLREAV